MSDISDGKSELEGVSIPAGGMWGTHIAARGGPGLAGESEPAGAQPGWERVSHSAGVKPSLQGVSDSYTGFALQRSQK